MRGISVYHSAQRAAHDPQQFEHDALLRTAREMEAAEHGPGRERILALHRNTKLWQAFAADCSESGNQLPDDIRAKIVSLALWVYNHTEKAIIGELPVRPLAEVNRTIAKGLAAAIEARNADTPAPPPLKAAGDYADF
ncbi:MAG: flagellar biosynthesis regulator FlaF [Rhodospirillaceae bacterium]